MRWDDRGESSDVEDRRGQGGGGGGGGGLKLGLGGTLVVFALSIFFKRDLFALLGAEPGVTPSKQQSAQPNTPVERPEEQKLVSFVSFVLDDVQKTWAQKIPSYHKTKLVLFDHGTRSGCGSAESAMGPFYCPMDEKVYIDLEFYRELARRYGAPGQFAEAYVLAHEIGHHVQNLLGTERKLRQAQGADPAQKNALSVKMELQADCYAGIWANTTNERKLLEAGDLESAIGAAAAVGDDRLQKAATGTVMPERWTHGSSAQRTQWFQRGYKSGRLEDCDTFAAE